MACDTDMDYSNSALPRRDKKKSLKIGLMYVHHIYTYGFADIFPPIDLYNQSLFLFQKFSPWEIPRHDVVFPVRFFGHVEILPDGS